jgi:hypothetical protein
MGDRFAASAVTRARELLVAALGNVPERPIVSLRVAARVAGEPYDAARVELFGRVRDDIERPAPSVRPEREDPAALRWLPFFEAYFSNYIEGTRFSVAEAHDIALLGLVPTGRPEDAHDVSATFRIVSDPELMQTRCRPTRTASLTCWSSGTVP